MIFTWRGDYHLIDLFDTLLTAKWECFVLNKCFLVNNKRDNGIGYFFRKMDNVTTITACIIITYKSTFNNDIIESYL